jgi:DNA-directed RNA polymerase specialized sigma24 family protein
MAAKLTQNTKDEFVARYQQGENVEVLATLLCIHPKTCRKLLRDANIEIRGRTRVCTSEHRSRDTAIREDFELGLDINELSVKYKKAKPTISVIISDLYQASILERNNKVIRLHEEGLTLREIGEIVELSHGHVRNILDNTNTARLTYPHLKINESKLSTECPELFYWLGWAATDGCIVERENNYRYQLALQAGDAYIIERFSQFIEVDRFRLHTYQPKDSVIGNQIIKAGLQSCWRITNSGFQVWVDKYGIVPNKTYNFVIPQIPDEYFGHYLRGAIEGDGSIRIELSNRIFNIQLAGSLPFLEWMTSKLRYFGYTAAICLTKRNDIYGVINMQGKNNIEWLYHFCDGSNPLRLDRKWRKLDRFFSPK